MSAANWTPLVLVSTLSLVVPATAQAQETPPSLPSAPALEVPPGLADSVLRAVGDRPVIIQLVDGQQLAVRILAVEPTLLVISSVAAGQVSTLPRASVTGVRLLPSAPPAAVLDRSEPPETAPPARKRHIAVALSVAPGFDLDLDAGLFHGFANISIVLPLATNAYLLPFSFGLGVGIPVSRSRPALKLDLFAHTSLSVNAQTQSLYSSSSTWIAVGAGIGLHYTWNSGLTLGFTVPILGYSAEVGKSASSGSSSTGTGVAMYYLTSVEGLPIGYIGYRF